MRIIAQYFFIFMIYSICGWIMETMLYAIRDKKIVKRGFLFGPVCPIYGTGAVILDIVLYNKIHNIFLLFLISLLLCGFLEYITHFIMEKLFHAMWWDYSSRKFNIKGRVYLNGLIQFGAGGVLIIRLFQPLLYKLLDCMNNTLIYSICFALYTLIIIDIVATVIDLKNVIHLIKYIQNFTITKTQNGLDYVDEYIKENEKISDAINWLKNDNALVRRVRQKYPNIKSKKYGFVLDIIMNKPDENKQRKDIKLYGTAESIPESDINKTNL